MLLFLQPCQEIVDTGAADGHLEGGLWLRYDLQTSAGLLDDACYGLHLDYAAAGDAEEDFRIQLFCDHVKR